MLRLADAPTMRVHRPGANGKRQHSCVNADGCGSPKPYLDQATGVRLTIYMCAPLFSVLITFSKGYGGSFGGGGGYGGGGYSGGYGGGGGYNSYSKSDNIGGGLKTIDWSNTRLEKFEKNFYHEDTRVSQRSDRDVDEFRRAKEMKVRYQARFHVLSAIIDRLLFVGIWTQRPSSCHVIRGSWFPRIYHVYHSCSGFL